MGQPEEAIRTILATDSAWNTAMAGRTYPFRAPQGAATPYCIMQRSSGDQWNHMVGQSTKAQVFVDLEIYGDSYDSVLTLLDRARITLGGFRGNVVIAASPLNQLFFSSIWLESFGMLGPDANNGSDMPQFGAHISLDITTDIAVA